VATGLLVVAMCMQKEMKNAAEVELPENRKIPGEDRRRNWLK